MAQRPRKLKLVYSRRALAVLDEIWSWTGGRFGIRQAESYNTFLTKNTDGLAANPLIGRIIDSSPQYRYLVLKLRKQGHGHLVVYQVHDDFVEVLTYYHTAQDWKTKIAREEW